MEECCRRGESNKGGSERIFAKDLDYEIFPECDGRYDRIYQSLLLHVRRTGMLCRNDANIHDDRPSDGGRKPAGKRSASIVRLGFTL